MFEIPNRSYGIFSRYQKISQPLFLCDIFLKQNFAKYRKSIAKYGRYHRYRDRKRVVHQVKYMTFSRRYCRYRRCRMFFLPVSYDFGAFCRFFYIILQPNRIPNYRYLQFGYWKPKLRSQLCILLRYYCNRTTSKIKGITGVHHMNRQGL